MKAVVTLLYSIAAIGLAVGDTRKGHKCDASESVYDAPPPDPNADPFMQGYWYVNKDRTIWAGWDATRMKAGTEGNKVLWIRPQGSILEIEGQLLNTEQGTIRVEQPCCYTSGFQSSAIYFDKPGCWRISARAGDVSLVFVTRVR